MKLNKPPVSEEQTVLEEYVDFLLTDKSNVTPLPAKSATDQKLERVIEADDEKPKWTTIEKATKGFETAEHKIARIKKELNEVVHHDDQQKSEEITDEFAAESNIEQEKTGPQSSELESVESEASKVEQPKIQHSGAQRSKVGQSNIQRPEHPEPSNLETESQSKLEKDKTRDDEFSLLAEEEEAKAWDVVLTKEKEQALLKELDSNELSEADKARDGRDDKAATVDGDFSDSTASSGLDKATSEKESENSQTRTKVELPAGQGGASSSIQNKTKELIEEFLPHKEEDERLVGVERLLARISLATQPKVEEQTEAKVQQSESVATENEISQQAAEASFVHREAEKLKNILPEVFQTLIFEVGTMPLAVPLLKLGGIVKISSEDITPLVGTPDWFVGLVPNDRGNLLVVDTQNYLMPEQAGKTADEMNYEYLILLDDSNWALACNSVGDAKNLVQDDIRWSERSSRRPWFAGMVVEYMSALIEVDELINMLADTITEK
ncbi:MAG: chemotaxis protein CheW [Kangiellaceae bacterium]|nr:chemotaxis protein CheW [Kangiellaceae bacterium]MCW9000801.1 chemotaxis protein CheW [Kangiellaceae bacterium]MCW9015953.1 chemotaxis protein CheW [Kangiellaceae bacterium]